MYGRGRPIALRSVRDKKLRSALTLLELKFEQAALQARETEVLLEHAAGGLEADGDGDGAAALERTYKVRQDEVRQAVGLAAARNGFELRLAAGLGPYLPEYSRTGADLLLASRRGHVATTRWRAATPGCELQLADGVRDAKWLHNSQYFALAQKQAVYIYDSAGVEIHQLPRLARVTHMEFLPSHFLLATVVSLPLPVLASPCQSLPVLASPSQYLASAVTTFLTKLQGQAGYLKYLDTSTGKMVAEMPMKQRSPTAMSQSPYNAIVHVGHQNGTVSLWSPNSASPLVKILAHRGPVRSLAIDRLGRYMVSTGQDLRMAVWDLRAYRQVNNYFLRKPGSSLAISDRGLTAVSWGTQVSVWKDLFSDPSTGPALSSAGTNTSAGAGAVEKVKSPYMSWGGDGRTVERVRWCPYEDVLGVGLDDGFASLIIPGAGEPNFDSLEANPFENTKQRQEAEVKALLNKIQPEMISIDPNFVGQLDLASPEQRRKEAAAPAPAASSDRAATAGTDGQKDELEKLKDRGTGRNSALRKHLRKAKAKDIIDERRLRIEALWEEQKLNKKQKADERQQEVGPALARFVRGAG